MTYRPLCTFQGATLKSVFETLLQNGHTLYSARALLGDLLESAGIKTEPPLLTPWQLRFAEGNVLVIHVADGLLDPAQVFVTSHNMFPGSEPLAAFLDMPPTTAPPAANDDAAGRKAAEPSGAVADTLEERAVDWLAALLKLDDSVKRDAFKVDCKDKFKISEKRYFAYVWPEARKRRGLPLHGKPGPKRIRPGSANRGPRLN